MCQADHFWAKKSLGMHLSDTIVIETDRCMWVHMHRMVWTQLCLEPYLFSYVHIINFLVYMSSARILFPQWNKPNEQSLYINSNHEFYEPIFPTPASYNPHPPSNVALIRALIRKFFLYYFFFLIGKFVLLKGYIHHQIKDWMKHQKAKAHTLKGQGL